MSALPSNMSVSCPRACSPLLPVSYAFPGLSTRHEQRGKKSKRGTLLENAVEKQAMSVLAEMSSEDYLWVSFKHQHLLIRAESINSTLELF